MAKHTFLHDVAEDNKLDFIALSKTNRNSFSTQCLKISVRGLILFGIGGAPGYVRGMLMGINQGCFEVENIINGDYHIKVVLKTK